MWESLFKDPYLKVILVVFVGILAFMLLFSLFSGNAPILGMNGQNTGMNEHTGNMNGMGYSYGNLINGLLMLLINILILILVIAIVAGIIVWIKNNILKENNEKYKEMLNNDPVLRTAIIIMTAIVGIALVFSLLNGIMGTGTMGYNGNGMMNSGSNLSYGITGLIVALIKVLMFILVISLVIAAIKYISEQYNRGAFGSTVNTETRNEIKYDKEKGNINDPTV